MNFQNYNVFSLKFLLTGPILKEWEKSSNRIPATVFDKFPTPGRSKTVLFKPPSFGLWRADSSFERRARLTCLGEKQCNFANFCCLSRPISLCVLELLEVRLNMSVACPHEWRWSRPLGQFFLSRPSAGFSLLRFSCRWWQQPRPLASSLLEVGCQSCVCSWQPFLLCWKG